MSESVRHVHFAEEKDIESLELPSRVLSHHYYIPKHRTKHPRTSHHGLCEIELDHSPFSLEIRIPKQIGMRAKLTTYISLKEINHFIKECNVVITNASPHPKFFYFFFALPILIYILSIPIIILANGNASLYYILPFICIGISSWIFLAVQQFLRSRVYIALVMFIEKKNAQIFSSHNCHWKLIREGGTATLCLCKGKDESLSSLQSVSIDDDIKSPCIKQYIPFNSSSCDEYIEEVIGENVLNPLCLDNPNFIEGIDGDNDADCPR